ncbi:M23 family metallopeptidase [Muriicola sp.]|uniref:M23 family metallopeptidase n=1 Tax=Muriicola sp. TaxID=2020856 RepID=UPI003C73FC27
MKIISILLIALILSSCQTSRLPREKISQYSYYKDYSYEKDTLKISLSNPLHCPLRVFIDVSDTLPKAISNALNPLTLAPKSDTLIMIGDIHKKPAEVSFRSLLGDPTKKITLKPLQLPFVRNKEYRVIQAYKGSFTHNTSYSRYAIDFSLPLNDTISAATNGYVVGVIDGYKEGGKGAKWRPFANFITLYDPETGVYTQYVHLNYKGSLVSVGQEIRAGDPIGKSGLTGQTTIEHLHFNTLIPENSPGGMKSIPVDFEEGYKGKLLKRNDIVKK